MCKDSIFFWMSNIFVTYSAAPARCERNRLLSFAQPSLNLRLSFVTYSAAPARRLSFGEASATRGGSNSEFWILNFELMGLLGVKQKKRLSEKFYFVRAICQSPYNVNKNDWLSERLTLSNFESLLKCVALGVRQKKLCQTLKVWQSVWRICLFHFFFINLPWNN